MTTQSVENSVEEIPKFIKLRGCINCEISKKHKEETGNHYGHDHEKVAGCMIIGCYNYGHFLSKPFIDPQDVVKMAKEIAVTEEQKKNVKNYLLDVKTRF